MLACSSLKMRLILKNIWKALVEKFVHCKFETFIFTARLRINLLTGKRILVTFQEIIYRSFSNF